MNSEKRNHHVIPLGRGWAVKTMGSKGFTIITDRKSNAVKVGRELASNQKSILIVHGRDGRIQNRESFCRAQG